MIQIKDKAKCTGCTACVNICGSHAITMINDERGHSYPTINTDLCIECGLCEKICPMLHPEKIPLDENLEELSIYAVYNKDAQERKQSTSGGIFSLLARYILAEGGIVYAARFNEHFHIEHAALENENELKAFRGSKYAQSDLNSTFKEIRNSLKSRKVLFVGTPCQVAGLKAFLKKDYINLYTCDFICMGISSPVIWEEYLDCYWNRKEIKNIFFKDKRFGWHNWRMLIEDNSGEHLYKGLENPFMYSYLTHITYRPSCFSCPFRALKRMSDFTIADCWGIDKLNPDFDDNKGCTTLILQSSKSKSVFQKIRDMLYITEYKAENIIQYNPYCKKPIAKHKDTDSFYETYINDGFKIAANKFLCQRQNNPMKVLIERIKKVKFKLQTIICLKKDIK